jgi:hypothetical protein
VGRGVPEAEQELARALHAEGNAEFAELRFAQALAKYREALRHWDHPGDPVYDRQSKQRCPSRACSAEEVRGFTDCAY